MTFVLSAPNRTSKLPNKPLERPGAIAYVDAIASAPAAQRRVVGRPIIEDAEATMSTDDDTARDALTTLGVGPAAKELYVDLSRPAARESGKN